MEDKQLNEFLNKYPEIKEFIERELFVGIMKHTIGSHYWLLGI